MERYHAGARPLLVIIALMVFTLFSHYGRASVTMTGTRIIYNGGAKSTDIQLTNKSALPYMVTTWFDGGNMDDGPAKSAEIPFVVTPPVSRVQANQGQVLRLVYTGAKPLPQDRESVFYFNFLQLPPANVGADENGEVPPNSLTIALRNRVKLFYRPKGMEGNPKEMLRHLKVSRVDNTNTVKVENAQPFHVTINGLMLKDTQHGLPQSGEMLAPFASKNYTFTNATNSDMKSVRITLINDLGARISAEYPL